MTQDLQQTKDDALDVPTSAEYGTGATPATAIESSIASAARTLAEEPSLQETLDRTVELAVAMVEGCDAAGISLVTRKGRIETPAASHDLARRGDELQYALNEGPCLDAIRETDLVRTNDLAAEPRWQQWADQVHEELGVRSMLCVQLFTSETSHGALNLYSRSTGAFPATALSIVSTFAAVAAAALTAARTEEQLTSAVQTRTVIGQAQGILMERYQLSPQRAFSVLSRVSQDSNVKLYDLAREVVETRKFPTA
ncbi:GAF and ANTAR domain-containing protein [Oerskovia sp. KBS0722]|uniref:GAF and ANTAR domain-containing protein n=1 Tax=Oerskovia sp. KBS0722 TaxID=1179673 RepID=UPI00110EDB43|nr:GAF and ANTAR domain-containing protein [Oerskovia sp. KBS0722]QDW63383.1 GAF and ANTAR domain-containing protein [Oerskovia sp. KBS0722]